MVPILSLPRKTFRYLGRKFFIIPSLSLSKAYFRLPKLARVIKLSPIRKSEKSFKPWIDAHRWGGADGILSVLSVDYVLEEIPACTPNKSATLNLPIWQVLFRASNLTKTGHVDLSKFRGEYPRRLPVGDLSNFISLRLFSWFTGSLSGGVFRKPSLKSLTNRGARFSNSVLIQSSLFTVPRKLGYQFKLMWELACA